MKKNKKIISYESSKWYIKTWRRRWYIYAIILQLKNLFDFELWLDPLLTTDTLDDNNRENLRKKWRNIKTNIELTKMYKFSAKFDRDD